MDEYSNRRIPPNNIIIEKIILGYLLSNSKIKKQVINGLHSNFFILHRHQILFSKIASISTTSKSVNINKVINILWSNNLLEEIGGIEYLFYIIQKSQSIFEYSNQYEYIQYFIAILQSHYAKRLFLQYSYSIFQLNYFHKLSVKQIYIKAINYLNIIANSISLKNDSNFKNDVSLFLRQINKFNKKSAYISSGFKDLDKITQGFKQSELVIVAGRPSMGKTSFAINIIYNLIFNFKLSVHMFSLEMSRNEILDKLIAIASNVSLHHIKNRIIIEEEWVKIQKICKLLISYPLNIDDEGNASIEYIKSQCKDYIVKKKPQLLLTIYN